MAGPTGTEASIKVPTTRREIHRALRRRARSAIVQWRLISGGADRRGLPDYIVVGAQKAGTTSLQKALAGHPDVYPSLVKEVHYFDLAYDRGDRWYRAHFGPERIRVVAEKRGRTLVMGEASPLYLACPQAVERAASTVPHARLIVLLRNPVERAYSHYRHEVRLGHERTSFSEAIARELDRGDGGRAPPESVADLLAWQHQSYLFRGLYAEQLAAWMRWFPSDQFLILRSEDYFARSLPVLDRVCAFLGVQPASTLPRSDRFRVHHNKGARWAPMSPKIREQLEGYYAEPNRLLGQLLNEPPWW